MRQNRRRALGSMLAVALIGLAASLAAPAAARAVFGSERLLFRGPRQPTEAPEAEAPEREKKKTPDIGLTEREARPLIEDHYAQAGQWAGQYVIDDIARIRFVQRGPDRIHAHVRYRYRCIIDRCGGSLQQGYDQRVFYLERRGGRWKVIWMGGYMSAEME